MSRSPRFTIPMMFFSLVTSIPSADSEASKTSKASGPSSSETIATFAVSTALVLIPSLSTWRRHSLTRAAMASTASLKTSASMVARNMDTPDTLYYKLTSHSFNDIAPERRPEG